MAHEFQRDIDAVDRISAAPTILDVVCATTGMGFAAIARVTDERWIACKVKDKIAFGLTPGSELAIETSICNEIKQRYAPVAIDNVGEDELYCNHHTPRMYGFQSYIAMPIILTGRRFFGTLCAIDPRPAHVKNAGMLGMFSLFSELISVRLDAMCLDNEKDEYIPIGGSEINRVPERARELELAINRLQEAAKTGRSVELSARLSEIVGSALESHVADLEQTEGATEFPYRVVLGYQNDTNAQTIARVANLSLAKAIFDAATKFNPRSKIRLFEGSTVIAETVMIM
jgi:GAF domain-containing protein